MCVAEQLLQKSCQKMLYGMAVCQPATEFFWQTETREDFVVHIDFKFKSSLVSTILKNVEAKVVRGRSESIPGNCLSKTQLPANSQEDV